MTAPPDESITDKVEFVVGEYTLSIATGFGPRITGLARTGESQIFASLGTRVRIARPGHADYLFHGGHRLWVAPEEPDITYASDDHACVIEHHEGGLSVSAPRDEAGFIKTITVEARDGTLIVSHRLAWEGTETVDVAPWAITQFPLQGEAILPLPGREGSSIVQADRSLVLWPYTDLSDSRLIWRSSAVVVEGSPGPRLKIGADAGKVGYHHQGQLFIKEFEQALPGLGYPERGAVAQVFVDEAFLELESVGPVASLESGGEAVHTERWRVIDVTGSEEAVEMLTGNR